MNLSEAAIRGRRVLGKLFGGNIMIASGNCSIMFDACRPFDRDLLTKELRVEFSLLVTEEEIPTTLKDFDLFCERIVSEGDKRDPKKHKFLYCLGA